MTSNEKGGHLFCGECVTQLPEPAKCPFIIMETLSMSIHTIPSP
jgi:hypothetical protein